MAKKKRIVNPPLDFGRLTEELQQSQDRQRARQDAKRSVLARPTFGMKPINQELEPVLALGIYASVTAGHDSLKALQDTLAAHGDIHPFESPEAVILGQTEVHVAQHFAHKRNKRVTGHILRHAAVEIERVSAAARIVEPGLAEATPYHPSDFLVMRDPTNPANEEALLAYTLARDTPYAIHHKLRSSLVREITGIAGRTDARQHLYLNMTHAKSGDYAYALAIPLGTTTEPEAFAEQQDALTAAAAHVGQIALGKINLYDQFGQPAF